MGFVRIDLSEIHALAAHLRKAGDTITPKAEHIVAAGGHRTVAAIQNVITELDLIDTGNMRAGTSVDINGLGFEAGSEASYSVFQDQGTSELPANNFHAKGFDRVLPSIEDALAEAGSQIL